MNNIEVIKSLRRVMAKDDTAILHVENGKCACIGSGIQAFAKFDFGASFTADLKQVHKCTTVFKVPPEFYVEERETDDFKGEMLCIKHKRRVLQVPMIASFIPPEYPPKPKEWIDIPADVSANVDSLIKCASNNPALYELSCVHFGEGYAESSDNFQMFRMEFSEFGGFCVSAKVLKGLWEIEPQKISMDGNRIWVKNNNMWAYCVASDIEYHDLSPFLEGEGKTFRFPSLVIKKLEIAKKLADTPESVMNVSIKNKVLHMKSIGNITFEEECPMPYKGEPLSFSVNLGHFLSALKNGVLSVTLCDATLRLDGNNWSHVLALQ